MILTLEIPAELDVARRKALANALSEAGLLTSEQATALLVEDPAKTLPLTQGSPEWKALLYQKGPASGVTLSPETTSREAIYGDDLR